MLVLAYGTAWGFRMKGEEMNIVSMYILVGEGATSERVL